MLGNKDLFTQYTVLSNNIRYYRKRLGFTQEQLAEAADLSISYIKQIESGKEFKNVSLTTMLKISKVLNVGLDTLFKLES